MGLCSVPSINPPDSPRVIFGHNYQFDIEIKHRPGLCNQAADYLFRYTVNALIVKDTLEVNNKEDPNFDSLNLEKLKENQSKDKFCYRDNF
ncbi:hypothetical protein QTP88_011450 [Uroleucon formosanum]